MITVVLIMCAGMLLGYIIRHKTRLIPWVGRFTSWSIYILLFLLGVAIGVNQIIVNNLPVLGLKALIITLGGVSGSLFMAWILHKLVSKSSE